MWIRFPTAAPANPNPSAHSTNNTISNVQSIVFSSWFYFCLVVRRVEPAVGFVVVRDPFEFASAVVFVVVRDLFEFASAVFLAVPSTSAPASAAPFTAPLATAATTFVTASVAFAISPAELFFAELEVFLVKLEDFFAVPFPDFFGPALLEPFVGVDLVVEPRVAMRLLDHSLPCILYSSGIHCRLLGVHEFLLFADLQEPFH